MEALLILLVVFYLLTVLVSWLMIKLIYDEVPAKFAFVPVFNLLLPFIDARRMRGVPRHASANATAEQELDIAAVAQMPILPGVPGPMFPPVRLPERQDHPRR